jgi:acetyl esterase/lipase
MSRKADISAQAKAVISELRAAGLTVPSLETLAQYRIDTRAGYAPNVERALAEFDGEISDIEVAGISCKQVTPSGWSQSHGPCIQYAYGGGYVGGSTYEDLVIALPLAKHCAARIVLVDYRLSPGRLPFIAGTPLPRATAGHAAGIPGPARRLRRVAHRDRR